MLNLFGSSTAYCPLPTHHCTLPYLYTMRIPILLSLIFLSCNDASEDKPKEQSENNIDAARNFLEASLKGNFDEAKEFMIQDSLNEDYLDKSKRMFHVNMNEETRQGLRGATIRIHDVKNISDSASTIIYSNSFMNNHDTLRVNRINGEWLVDLKTLFQPVDDSTKN